jgi:hypothetical protein
MVADTTTGEKVVATPMTEEGGRKGKKMGGAVALSPADVKGGRRRSRKISKKMMAKLKKMTPKQLKKLAKGGVMEVKSEEGGRRHRRTHRRGMFY